MSDVVGLIQSVIRDQLRCFRTAEIGIVTKVHSHEQASDMNNYECDVRLRDSGLELPRVPAATQRIGFVAIPNIDDLVLVQFAHGDVHAPYITGRLYNDTDRPPKARPREAVYVSPDPAESGVRRFYSELPNGNTITLDDEKLVLKMGSSTVTVNHDGEIVLNSHNQNIKLTDQNGNNSIEIAVQQGQIRVQAQMKVVVEAPQIELVQGATHPLVYGDQLLQYLNQLVAMYQSHVHPGELALGVFPVTPAPPVPPFPPATPSLLSFKVKTG
jgi:hypothetical protein